MPWQVSGTFYTPCNCNVGCPCNFGEPEADQGGCSAALFDIRGGSVDGVDVGGTRVVFAADWPRAFTGGGGTGRWYFDPSLSPQQRSALEAVVSGRRGGFFEVLASLVPNLLPPQEAAIVVQPGPDGEMRATVGDLGELVTVPMRGENGQVTRLVNAAATLVEDTILGRGSGSRWRDPELKSWESGGHAEQGDFDWSG